jgi:hypothetical protein
MNSPYWCGTSPEAVFGITVVSPSREATLRVGRVLVQRAKAHLILAPEDVWLTEVLSVLGEQKVRG